MKRNSDEMSDKIFLSYWKILNRLHDANITKKNGTAITELDLRKAILVMLKKHPACRWRSERIKSKRYYVLIEGYFWLRDVYFQKEKTLIDADIDFFKTRIKLYKELLKIDSIKSVWDKDMSVKELAEYFNRDISTVRQAIAKMCNAGYSSCKSYKDGKVIISFLGIAWLSKNIFKQKYLELLEEYKMELTEKYIAAGYPYDHFLGKEFEERDWA